jgi:hypothetical protein
VNDAIGWLLAVAGGLGTAWIAYPARSVATWRALLFLLRMAAVAIIAALALDLAVGRAAPPPPIVALDVSASWLRTGDSTQRSAAQDSASRVARGAPIMLFGDSARDASTAANFSDQASMLAPVIARAAASGASVVVVTDGALDDADALQRAAPGSRVIALPLRSAQDRAVADITAPAEARVGDTITLQARIVSDAAMPTAAKLTWLLDGASVAESEVPALSAGGEALVESQIVIAAGDSNALLRAVLPAGSDIQPRNDTASITLRRGARQRLVVVSTAPDADVRDVNSALRANVPLPIEAFYRIAPGRWVRDGALTVVEESVVRAAARGSTLLVLHGDTLVLGAPATLGSRALLLLAPPDAAGAEMLVRTPPASPLQAALGGIVVESLPPLIVGSGIRGGTPALTAAPRIATGGGTSIVTATDGAVRRVVIAAAGYSRWRTRGGVSELAFGALTGAVSDWLLAARGTSATPTLVRSLLRAGTPVRWQRGGQASAVLLLTRDGDRATRRDSLLFGERSDVSSPPLGAGIWRGTVDGAAVVLAVNASAEWLPRSTVVQSGAINGVALPLRRGARSVNWLYLAGLLLLASEWLLRRKAGLR